MKFNSLLVGCSLMMAVAPAIAADYPEKLYLVGTMNGWILPASGHLVEIPSVGEGLYSATMDIEASENEDPVSFKIFNTITDNWMDGSEYYGAIYPDNYSNIYKDTPATWMLAPGFGSNDIVITNVTSLTDAVVTVDLKEGKLTIASETAPAAPQEVYLVDGGEDGYKYPLQREENTSVFKGSVTLGPGALRLAFTGNNGFLLGANTGIYYLWKDRQANYTMKMDSHAPFVVGNWSGGTLEVSVNITNSTVTFRAPDQPAFPETINMVMKGENGEDTKVPIPAIESEYGEMNFQYTLQDWQKDVQFTLEVPGIGVFHTDSEPIELWKNQSNYIDINPDWDNSISVSNWEGGDLTVFVPETFSYIRLVSSTQPLPKQTLYLVGSPQGWDINSDEMKLTQIDNHKFVGEFDMPANPIFRFYTVLGDWNFGSIGAQQLDIPVEVELEAGEELNVNMVYGKGPWNFTGFPGGKMYMEVDTWNMKATFSTSPLSGVAMTESDDVRLSAVVGGVEVIAPQDYETVVYDMTGRIAGKGKGTCRISLLPGLYIANKEKVMVK